MTEQLVSWWIRALPATLSSIVKATRVEPREELKSDEGYKLEGQADLRVGEEGSQSKLGCEAKAQI